MNRLVKCFAISTLIVFFSPMVNAENGVIISTTSKDLNSGAIANTKLYLMPTKVMVKNTGSDNSTLLFDASTEVFTYIDHNKKEYYEFDKPTLQQLKQQLKMMVQMMKQFASQMPESEKKKFDRLLNPDKGEAIQYNLLGGTEKVGKWKTAKYAGISNDEKVLEMNIATFSEIGIAKEKFNVMTVMMNYFKTNLKEVMALLPTGGSFSQLSIDENSPVMTKGLPVKTTTFQEGKTKNENVVNKIEEVDIKATLFEIPAGYTARQINLQQQLGR